MERVGRKRKIKRESRGKESRGARKQDGEVRRNQKSR